MCNIQGEYILKASINAKFGPQSEEDPTDNGQNTKVLLVLVFN